MSALSAARVQAVHGHEGVFAHDGAQPPDDAAVRRALRAPAGSTVLQFLELPQERARALAAQAEAKAGAGERERAAALYDEALGGLRGLAEGPNIGAEIAHATADIAPAAARNALARGRAAEAVRLCEEGLKARGVDVALLDALVEAHAALGDAQAQRLATARLAVARAAALAEGRRHEYRAAHAADHERFTDLTEGRDPLRVLVESGEGGVRVSWDDFATPPAPGWHAGTFDHVKALGLSNLGFLFAQKKIGQGQLQLGVAVALRCARGVLCAADLHARRDALNRAQRVTLAATLDHSGFAAQLPNRIFDARAAVHSIMSTCRRARELALLRRAAAVGLPHDEDGSVHCNLGLLEREEANAPRAMELWAEAARRGNGDACVERAIALSYGECGGAAVVRDEEEARALFARARSPGVVHGIHPYRLQQISQTEMMLHLRKFSPMTSIARQEFRPMPRSSVEDTGAAAPPPAQGPAEGAGGGGGRGQTRTLRACLHCGKGEALRPCSRCKLANFCGPECQRRAWPAHKLTCKAFVAAQAAGAGQLDARQAALQASFDARARADG